ncbi:MAG: hypothetical protein V4590_01525 [Bacteroidota bacterium]
MEVIALTGDPHAGKSETLNIVYQLMLWHGYIQVPGHFKVLGNPVMRDFIDVLENGVQRVGIVSQGDYQIGANSLKNHLLALQHAGCVKAVCACTNKPGTLAVVNSYIPHHLVNKTLAATLALQRIENGKHASTLYSFI